MAGKETNRGSESELKEPLGGQTLLTIVAGESFPKDQLHLVADASLLLSGINAITRIARAENQRGTQPFSSDEERYRNTIPTVNALSEAETIQEHIGRLVTRQLRSLKPNEKEEKSSRAYLRRLQEEEISAYPTVNRIEVKVDSFSELQTIFRSIGSLRHDIGTKLTIVKGYYDLTKNDPAKRPIYYKTLSEVIGRLRIVMDGINPEMLKLEKSDLLEDKKLKNLFSCKDFKKIFEDAILSSIEPNHIDINVIGRKYLRANNIPPSIENHYIVYPQDLCFRLMYAIAQNLARTFERRDKNQPQRRKELKRICVDYDTSVNNELLICLRDTGTGFDQEIIKNGFQSGYTTDKEFGGTGQGIGEQIRLLRTHGGNVFVYNRVDAEGKVIGAGQIIALPMAKREEIVVGERGLEPPTSRSQTARSTN